MRILQIIDSLDVGGAEKMAVNYANTLSERIEFSGLVVSRKEGSLRSLLNKEVKYLFLDRKKVFDFRALKKLKTFCIKENIAVVHAHGTSFFLAFLLKLVCPKVKVIWHEHLGSRSSKKMSESLLLRLCAFTFSGIIVVNQQLENWCKTVLGFNKIILLKNFTLTNIENKVTILNGQASKRIVYLANLKNPKNHKFLVEVAKEVLEKNPNWTFHLIGKDFEDDYSNQLKNQIQLGNLKDKIFIYGLKLDTFHILSQCDIAVMTSSSEGMPVSLVEYGLMKLPVVATNVGEIPFVIENDSNGFLVEVDNVIPFSNSICKLIENEALRITIGNSLFEKIHNDYSKDIVINNYLNWLKTL
jgi:glycosyltransferase involved in cell wall biosynthesis